MKSVLLAPILAVLLGTELKAQQGDKPGEEQRTPTHFAVPPAPPLTPAQALASLKVAAGFKVELAASEPLIEAPVALTFGPDGRLWVVEMRGYMRDPDGAGEDKPLGRISVLSDEDGDGTMDHRVVFAEGLVMPRALALAGDGVLVAEPPRVWWMRDTDGDGKADQKEEVFQDYGTPANPEHSSNGLVWGLDNWLYSANHTTRYRLVDGKWVRETTAFRGQWGLSQDDYGRFFHNSNSDQLRADLIPSRYLARNPNLRNPLGINVQIAQDQSVWPIRVNPGVNRGYQPGQLRPDGTLATFTAACGPCVYRGDHFPSEFLGNAFLCEPTGNIVRCNRVREHGATVIATNAFPQAEFLASTDERFRPVSLANGPDGALYIADLARGIVEHKIYLTTYLRKQIVSRELDRPLDLGRIWRVVSADKPRSKPANLARLTTSQLVEKLNDANGWVRDTAQRLLVEKRETNVLPALRKLAADDSNPLGQIHALWTLEGVGRLDKDTVLNALRSANAKTAIQALQLCERFLNEPGTLETVLDLPQRDRLEVLWQMLLTLGESSDKRALEAMVGMLQDHWENPYLRDAAISGLRGRELTFLDLATQIPKDRRTPLVVRLASCVAVATDHSEIPALLEWAARHPESASAALDGILTLAPQGTREKPAQLKPIRLKDAPPALAALEKMPDPEIQTRVGKLKPLLEWPKKEGASIPKVVKPLTAEEQALFDNGKALYLATCGACHQPHGMGQEGLAPPLLESDWAVGSPYRLARIVLNGVRGPITVKGKIYALDMPPLGVLDDEQLASLLTYVRREWGHTANPVSPAFIARVREATSAREEAWSEAELLKIP